LLVWGTPANFNRFRVLAALLHGTLVNDYKLCCKTLQYSKITGPCVSL